MMNNNNLNNNVSLATLPNSNEMCLFSNDLNSDYKCKNGLPGIETNFEV